MGFTRFIKNKPLTQKEELEREYKKKQKILTRKILKSPMKLSEHIDAMEKLFNDAYNDGVITEAEKDKNIARISIEMDKINKLSDKINKFKMR